MKYRSVDTDILVVVALASISAIVAPAAPANIVPIRILTLPLVLLLPGYALTSAIFPRRSPGVPERLVFSMGLSVVIVILGGLVLNWTPFGLRTGSWAVFLTSITLGACAIAHTRRRRQGITLSDWGWLGIRKSGFTFRQGLLLSTAALLVCGAITVSVIGAAGQPRPGFTQLWLLPAGGTNPKNAVQFGVSNLESTALEYSLDISMEGKLVKVWPSIDLQPNEKWEATLVLPRTEQSGSTKVEAMLYRADAPTTIYRQVVLWLGT